MTLSEIRFEIKKEIDQLPESILPEILAVLHRLKAESSCEDRRQRSFKKIPEENDGLFRRLAQYDTEL
jgi:hypothetical protein